MISFNLQFFGGRGSAGGNKVSANVEKTSASAVKKPTMTESKPVSSKSPVDKLKEPEKAGYSSNTKLNLGDRYGTVVVGVAKLPGGKFKATLTPPRGGGRYESAEVTSFEAARDRISRLVENHVNNVDRFKKKKLSEDDLRLLMNGM